MATSQLFTSADLGAVLQSTVTEASAVTAERLAWGWLKPVLGVDERPDPVSPELWAWAVQLGAIAHENPALLSAYQLGDERSQYSDEARQQILALAAAGGQVPSGGVPRPRGSFPAAVPWPDPIRPVYYRP